MSLTWLSAVLTTILLGPALGTDVYPGHSVTAGKLFALSFLQDWLNPWQTMLLISGAFTFPGLH